MEVNCNMKNCKNCFRAHSKKESPAILMFMVCCELRLCLPLDVQKTMCMAWMKTLI